MLRAWRRLLSCLPLAAAFVSSPAGAQPIALTLDAIEHPAFSARQISLQLNSLSGGSADLDIGRLAAAGRVLTHVRLHCGEFRWSPQRVECRHGELHPAGVTALPMEFVYAPPQRRLELSLGDGDIATLAALLPELAAWHPGGRVTASIKLDATHADVAVQLREAAFADSAGKIAAEKIAVTLEATLQRQGRAWNWQAKLDWPQGEAYFAPLYRKGGMHLVAAGRYAPELLKVERAELNIDDIGTLNGTLQWQPGSGKLRAANIDSGSLDLATLVPQFVQPFIDLQAGKKLQVSGKARIGLTLDDKGIARADIDIDDAGIAAGDASLKGIQTKIPWRRETATQASIRFAGGNFGSLPLGAVDLSLAMHGFDFSLPRAEIPLLDGMILFEDFHAVRNADKWQWKLAGALYPISMPLLTKALGLPQMDGILSASIPNIHYANETLELEGALIVSVFDGYLSATDLKVFAPFGPTPRVHADIEARHLDLGMLTHTFSFGDITGYVDADVKGLEMSGKQPLAFDAQVLSGSGDYPKRISQRAVQNISSLGGAGAGAAIQRSFLHFFDTFGYEQIGLSCRLVNDICLMGGIPAENTESGYTLIKGGGIPALNVIGYNRRVHWEELVSRVQAVIAGNSKIEIR